MDIQKIALGAIAGVCALGSLLLYQSQHSADDFAVLTKLPARYSLPYVNGYIIGNELSSRYEGEDQKLFIDGLRRGLTGEILKEEKESSLQAFKSSWFNDKEVTEAAKAYYSEGYLAAKKVLKDPHYANPMLFLQGYMDTLRNPNLDYLNPRDAVTSSRKYQQKLTSQEKVTAARRQAENKRAGLAFLEENATQPGVVTLRPGLQFKVLVAGDGETVKPKDTVIAHIETRRISGEVISNSRKQEAPVKGIPEELGPTWVDIMTRLSRGSVWDLYTSEEVSKELRMQPPAAKPGDALIHRIEIIEIQRATP